MFQKPFSFDGRIRRTEYGISIIIYYVSLVCISLVGEPGALQIIALLFYVPFVWFMLAQGAKRCHDRGRSGWYQIIPFYFLVLLFSEGYPGFNEYGDDPKRRNESYDDIISG